MQAGNSLDLQEVHQISLYVQHDEHVQQVIDEQFLVQCWKGMAQGLVSYQDGFSNFVDKTLSRSMTTSNTDDADSQTSSHQSSLKIQPSESAEEQEPAKTVLQEQQHIQKRILNMVPMEPMTKRPVTRMASIKSSDLITVKPESSNMVDIGTVTNDFKEDQIPSNQRPKASGWMEVIKASNDKPLLDSTEVGTPVKLVIRLKQVASMDTMLSTCTAHSGDDFYDLTDYRGCSADPEILPNFKAFFNSRTGVKRLTSSFPMFKFPHQSKVVVRCTVLVCNKNCPVAKCGQDEDDIADEANILDKFYLDTFAQVHDAGVSKALIQDKSLEDVGQIARTPVLR